MFDPEIDNPEFEKIKNDLESRGYHMYPRTPFQGNFVVCNFQKRFDDNRGKKYFIDAVVWDNSFVPRDRRDEWWHPYNTTYETQLYGKIDHDALDLEYHSSWKIEDVEKHLEQLWNTELFEHYEEWDEWEKLDR